MIIGISGKIGSGKDTVGKIIQYLTAKEKFSNEVDCKSFCSGGHKYLSNKDNPNLTFEIKKFAEKLKQIVSLLTGCTVEDLEKQEVKNRLLPIEWQELIQTPTNEDTRYTERTVRWLLQYVGTNLMRDNLHTNVWVNALMSEYKTKSTLVSEVNYLGDSRCGICKKPTKDISYFLCDEHVEKSKNNFPNWIITDMRFPNELQAVKDRSGITIRCNRSLQNIKGVKAIDSKDDEKVKELMKGIELIKSGNAKINSKGMIGTEGNDIAYNSMFNDHPSETALDNATFDYVLDNNSTIEELVEQIKQILIEEKII